MFSGNNPADAFFENLVSRQNEVNGNTDGALGQRELELLTYLLMQIVDSAPLPAGDSDHSWPGREHGATWKDWTDLRAKLGRMSGEPGF